MTTIFRIIAEESVEFRGIFGEEIGGLALRSTLFLSVGACRRDPEFGVTKGLGAEINLLQLFKSTFTSLRN